MSSDYTPPIQLDSGRVEIDAIPDSDGDLELVATLEDMHVAYLRPADQITLRDLLNRLHPPQPRMVTTVEELDALPVGAVVLSACGLTWAKDSFVDDPEFPFWVTPGESRQHNAHRITLPVTVLHEGNMA